MTTTSVIVGVVGRAWTRLSGGATTTTTTRAGIGTHQGKRGVCRRRRGDNKQPLRTTIATRGTTGRDEEVHRRRGEGERQGSVHAVSRWGRRFFARTTTSFGLVVSAEARRRRKYSTTTDRRRVQQRLNNRGVQRSSGSGSRIGVMSSAAATSAGGVVKEEEDSTTTFDSASADVERLGEWLALAGVDHASFSVKNGGTKTLVDLFNECVLGESTLTMHVNGKTGERMATRTTRVLTTRVRRRADVERGDDSKCLIELEQRFDNGKTRSRMRPLSEKMLPGEDWRACATRAVTEELGSALADGFSVHPLDDTYTFCISDRDSASYPGLPTRFALHRVDVIVDGLPDDDEFESVEALPNSRGFLRARWGFRDFAWTDDDLGPA